MDAEELYFEDIFQTAHVFKGVLKKKKVQMFTLSTLLPFYIHKNETFLKFLRFLKYTLFGYQGFKLVLAKNRFTNLK